MNLNRQPGAPAQQHPQGPAPDQLHPQQSLAGVSGLAQMGTMGGSGTSGPRDQSASGPYQDGDPFYRGGPGFFPQSQYLAPVGQKFLPTQPFSAPKVQAVNVDNPNAVYWQQQTLLCQLSRAEDMPHFYARQYAQNSRKLKNPYSDVKAVTLIDATKTIVAAMEEQEKKAQLAAASALSSALMRNKKTDLDEDEEHRMMARTHGKQLWCHMDLSGQGLLYLAPKLFQYDFLESLYLNNNKLTAVPPVISKLRGLRVLDLSHNRISELPPELGLCYNLRYLYLFDNNIKTLAPNFRNLIELVFLGIEGNPIDLSLANLLAEHGTKALITHFRDKDTSLAPPKPRTWFLLQDDGDIIDPLQNPAAYSDDQLQPQPDCFTMLSYNTLCQHYATTKMYKYTPSWALEWEYRREALKAEVLRLNTDLVCLQEVETRTYHEFWQPLMAAAGYKGFFFSKTRAKTMSEQESKKVDGCATFFRASKFQLIQKHHLEYNTVCMGSDRYKKTKDLFNRFMNKDHVALITYLQHTDSGEKVVLVNTHLHWDPAFNDVKALQVGILLEELQGIIRKFQGGDGAGDDPRNALVVICGDFNSTRLSAVYQLFSTGSVSKHEDMEGRDYGRFTDEGFHHSFKLTSAYDHIEDDFPFSNFTPTFTDEIDYIWYLANTLQVRGLLGKVDMEYFAQQIGIPDAHFPSDHIPLVAKFQIKKKGPGAAAKKPEFKPEFKFGSSRKT